MEHRSYLFFFFFFKNKNLHIVCTVLKPMSRKMLIKAQNPMGVRGNFKKMNFLKKMRISNI